MGQLNKKLKQMTDYDIEASADCPSMTFTFSGKTADEQEALSDTISAWTDGYTVELAMAMMATYFAEMDTDTSLEVAFGNAATTSAAENGAYNFGFDWTYGTTTADWVDTTPPLMSFYLTTAAVTSDGDL